MNRETATLLGWPAVMSPFVVWPFIWALYGYAAIRLRGRTLRRHEPAVDAHWTQHARFAWVARQDTNSLGGAVTALAVICGILVWHHTGWMAAPLIVASGWAALIATYVGFLHAFPRLDRSRGRIGAARLRERVRSFVWRGLILGFWVILPVCVVPFTTDAFDARTGAALAGGFALWVAWAVGALPLAVASGLTREPPAALTARADRIAASVGVSYNRLWVFRWSLPNAFAFPFGKHIAINEGLLELLEPDEVDGVLAHELSHLKEGWLINVSRLAPAIAFFTFTAALPVWGTWGALGLAALFIAVFAALLGVTAVARRAEHAADEGAHRHADSPSYARALEHLLSGGRCDEARVLARTLDAATPGDGTAPVVLDDLLWRIEACRVTEALGSVFKIGHGITDEVC